MGSWGWIDMQMICRNFPVLGFSVCSEIESKGGLEVRKILFEEKRRERLHGVMQWEPETQKLVDPESGWKLGLIAFFLLLSA
jgi:hypothetical protein